MHSVWSDMDHSPSESVGKTPHQMVEDVVWHRSTIKIGHHSLNHLRGLASLPPWLDGAKYFVSERTRVLSLQTLFPMSLQMPFFKWKTLRGHMITPWGRDAG